MTFDERLEQTLVEWGQACYHKWGGELQKKKAITAIKQAMRETMPERRKTTHQLRVRPHIQEQIDVDGYVIEIDGTFDQAIDEVEKGFGL